MVATHNNDELQQLRERVVKLEAEKASLASANVALQHKVQTLLHQLYGKKAERRKDEHPELPFPDNEPEPPPPPHVDEAEDDEYETITYKRRKRGATRISKDLPRETVVLEIPEADRKCPCCGDAMEEIGKEVSERIDYTPAVLKVIETVRPKYACKKHEESGVLTAPPPAHPINKGMATAGLLSQVLVSKYKGPPAALPAEPDLRASRRRDPGVDAVRLGQGLGRDVDGGRQGDAAVDSRIGRGAER